MLVSLLKFSTVVFEPLFFLGLLWGAVQLPGTVWFRRNSLRFFMLVCTIAMIAWRCAVHLWAGRYSAVLIIMLALWCVDCCRAFADSRWLNRWYIGKVLAFLLFTSLVTACVLKDLRINRHAKYILKCAQVIEKDAHDKPSAVIWSPRNAVRIGYYSGVPVISDLEMVAEDFTIWGAERFIRLYRNCGYPIYMILNECRKGGMITAESLRLQKSQWRFLDSFYKNNQENRVACVYLLDGRQGALPASERTIADYCRDYAGCMIANGRFEESMSREQQKSFTEQARQSGLLSFGGDDATYGFPIGWSIFNQTPFRDKNGEVGLTRNALEGQYSLRIKANDLTSIFPLEIFPAGNHEISFLACGKSGSRFELYVHIYDDRRRWLGCPRMAVFLADGQPHLYHVEIRKDELRNASCYRLCPAVKKGEVRFDAFSIRAIEDKRKVADIANAPVLPKPVRTP